MRQRHILPTADQSILSLGKRLGSSSAWCIGELPELRSRPGWLSGLLSSFRRCPGAPPIFSFLDELTKALPEKEDLLDGEFSSSLLGEMEIGNLVACLNALADIMSQGEQLPAQTPLKVFCAYVRELGCHPEFRLELLSDLSFPSRSGTWTSASKLSFEAEGVHPKHLLHQAVTEAFPQRLRSAGSGLSRRTENSEHQEPLPGKAIVEYFSGWEGSLPRPVVGGFLALLGDDPAIRQAAQDALQPRSVEGIRDQLDWSPLTGRIGGAGEDISTVMSKQRFRVLFGRDGASIRIPNMLGQAMSAEVSGEVSSVFIGSLFFSSPGDGPSDGLRYKTVTLRDFEPSQHSQQQLTNILLDSARLLLRKVYLQDGIGLDEAWSNLGQANQLQLDIVQESIMHFAWGYLDLVGCRRMRQLRELIRKNEELVDRKSEEKRYGEGRWAERLEEEAVELAEQLRRQLKTDRRTQEDVLGAVRVKMADYEYTARSIPFELFQNADDAAAELADMVGTDALDDRHARLIVQFEDPSDDSVPGHLTLVHWGRPINEFQRGGFRSKEGRRRGYHTDLRKMLLLSASDKSERNEIVTGKFGLGFKTVFFVTDEPRVVSGDLAFKVLAGFYPARLEPEVATSLRKAQEGFSGGCRDGTIIQLPLTDDGHDEVKRSLGEFRAALPGMLAFSRHLRECRLLTPDAPSSHRWVEEPLLSLTSLSKATLVAGGNLEATVPDSFLVFRDDHSGALLLGLDRDGATALAADFPTFWVTAPTKSARHLGFAINGAFGLDVGRRQLAESDANDQVARRLGRSVGQSMISLHDATDSDWAAVRTVLGLSESLTREEFWRSIWDVLTSAAAGEERLAELALWDRETGLAKLARERDIVPTSLPGQHDVQTGLARLEGIVKGILDSDPGAFDAASSLSSFAEKFSPGTLISAREPGRILRRCFGDELGRLEDVTVLSVLHDAIGPGLEVPPQLVATLSGLVNTDTLRDWEHGGKEARAECDAIREFLQALRFRTIEGRWSDSRSLLSPVGNTDEALRAAFAPRDRVLDEAYDEPMQAFFKACRGDLRAPASLLANWIMGAQARSTRSAGLRYVLEGELGREVAEILRERKRGTWLEALNHEDLRSYGFEEQEQFRLLAQLETSRSSFLERLGGGAVPPAAAVLRSVDAQDALDRIANWWDREGTAALGAYDARLYPAGKFPIALEDGYSVDREGWLSLFLLSIAQTVGRTSLEQNRNFLKLCQERGWVKALCEPAGVTRFWSNCWFEFMSGKVDRIEFYRWIIHLIGGAVVAGWLDEYIEAWLAADVLPAEFGLEQISNPRSSEIFSGGGPDAPPLAPILGVGQCFLLRELNRHGLVNNPHTHRWCYPPFASLRRLLERIGGPERQPGDSALWRFSPSVHRFVEKHLEDPTFGGAFDIPLQIVADDRALQDRLFGESFDIGSPEEE